jgi:hypothetical protein
VKNCTAAGNVSFKVNDFMRIAEEKFSCVNKDKWEAGCMYVKKIKE